MNLNPTSDGIHEAQDGYVFPRLILVLVQRDDVMLRDPETKETDLLQRNIKRHEALPQLINQQDFSLAPQVII